MNEWILYILFLVSILISLYAQLKVSLTFRRYSSVPTAAGRTAAETARMILDSHGLYQVEIRCVQGSLTDHYDPSAQVLALSEATYGNTSAAAVGVAAHEAGHAIQHAEGYLPIRVRSALVPVVTFASRAAWLFILLGILFTAIAEVSAGTGFGYWFLLTGVALFGTTTLFHLVTLPCEFNASSRALAEMKACGWYGREDIHAARRVLSAAALTYVAALLSSAIQLLRLIAIFGRRDNRR